MLTIFFCICLYSIAKLDKQRTPEIWFFVALAWIVAVALVTESRFSPILGFVLAFLTLWAKKVRTEKKPRLF